MAERPQTWVAWAEFFSKTIIAVAALFVTVGVAILTHAEQRRAGAQKALADSEIALNAERANFRADEVNERDTADFILKYVPDEDRARLQLSLAVAYCSEANAKSVRSTPNADLCRGVHELGTRRLAESASSAVAAAGSATSNRDPKAFLNSSPAAVQNAGLAASETALPISSNRWFAVVGTLPQSSPQAVRTLAQQLNGRLLGAGLPPNDVHVYRTKISKSFALTSGIDKTEADARARVRMLRAAGFKDAFAQPDREWTRADEFR